jgi:cyclic pyranopterin phosphate synthase
MPEPQLSHINEHGEAVMVDVSDKAVTVRTSCAQARLIMQPDTLARVLDSRIPKGDVWSVCRVAGIIAAKKTSDLIPLCHPLILDQVTVDFETQPPDCVLIRASARTCGRTGVEMEALTAVTVAALTFYDMVKAVDRAVMITDICLLAKSGGQSGSYHRRKEHGSDRGNQSE